MSASSAPPGSAHARHPTVDELSFKSLYEKTWYSVDTADGWSLVITRYKPRPQAPPAVGADGGGRRDSGGRGGPGAHPWRGRAGQNRQPAGPGGQPAAGEPACCRAHRVLGDQRSR